jgi:hypothetical protein
MIPTSVGRARTLTHPKTGRKIPVSVIREEIHVPPREGPPYDGKDWGKYVFGAWLEEDIKEPGDYYISFPYWRNGRFAGQYTLRAEPQIIRDLFKQMESRGWFARGS